MTDPLYSGEYFIDPGIIKQEPMTETNNTSASMPIPPRRAIDVPDLRDFGIELEVSNSPLLEISGQQDLFMNNASGVWNSRINVDSGDIKTDFKMDDDDIFQVDKADLIQGPTLAELNANDDTLLEDLNFDDLLLPEDKSYYVNLLPGQQLLKLSIPQQISNSNTINNNTFASSCPQNFLGFYKDSLEMMSMPSSPYDAFASSKTPVAAFSPASQHSSNSSLLQQSTCSPPPSATATTILQQKHSTLHELLLKKENFTPDKPSLGQSIPRNSMASTSGIGPHRTRTHSSRLSSSAPTHLGLDQIWQRREPRPHLLSTSSMVEAESTSSISTGGVLSPEAQDFSHDEGFDSDEDSEHYEDFSSDNDSDDDETGHSRSASKKERFFWQYNVQAKGPKGQRLVLKTKQEDPHVLNEVTDPVFSPNCAVRGIKHSGKARKGDGNDLTPNPRKLFNIGRELEKLGRIINDMTPVSELPFNARPKTRKEKNKLASRACRLKKKAQHEANKLKLYGLEQEHRRLLSGISQIKLALVAKLRDSTPEKHEELNGHIEKVVKSATKIKIAGHSTEYVNKVLDKVKSGVPGGGLDEIQT